MVREQVDTNFFLISWFESLAVASHPLQPDSSVLGSSFRLAACAPRAKALLESISILRTAVHKMRQETTILIEIHDSLVYSIPVPACPGCRMVKNEWPGEGYTHDGETYCCQGCAEGIGCMCIAVGKWGFSRKGQRLTRAEPRPGEQRSGAPAPQGELNGVRDSLGTEEALDQGG